MQACAPWSLTQHSKGEALYFGKFHCRHVWGRCRKSATWERSYPASIADFSPAKVLILAVRAGPVGLLAAAHGAPGAPAGPSTVSVGRPGSHVLLADGTLQLHGAAIQAVLHDQALLHRHLVLVSHKPKASGPAIRLPQDLQIQPCQTSARPATAAEVCPAAA